jgi:hypothetical protein
MILGVFAGFVDKFPLGAVMNKGLTIRSAQEGRLRADDILPTLDALSRVVWTPTDEPVIEVGHDQHVLHVGGHGRDSQAAMVALGDPVRGKQAGQTARVAKADTAQVKSYLRRSVIDRPVDTPNQPVTSGHVQVAVHVHERGRPIASRRAGQPGTRGHVFSLGRVSAPTRGVACQTRAASVA